MSDLRQRVPGHSLIDMLLHQWDIGTIRLDATTNVVVVDDKAVSWYRGVIGERRVGAILDSLGESHTVLHSVPVGKGSSDIDHVVIGRAGVFTINTKYSPGKKIWVNGYGVLIDGHSQPFVRNSIAEARRASDLLSETSGLTVPVTALIVFVDPGPITRKGRAGGSEHDPEVRVLADDHLFRVFMDRPVFSEEQVSRIVAAAVRPETWHRSPAESTVGHHITREFEALEEEVGPHLARAFVAPPKVSAPRMPAPSARERVDHGGARPQGTRTRTRSASSRRPASRKRRSSLDRMFSAIAVPAAALFGLWVYLNVITGK